MKWQRHTVAALVVLICSGVAAATSVRAQEAELNGTVTDDSGLPLPGVNIYVQASRTGTT